MGVCTFIEQHIFMAVIQLRYFLPVFHKDSEIDKKTVLIKTTNLHFTGFYLLLHCFLQVLDTVEEAVEYILQRERCLQRRSFPHNPGQTRFLFGLRLTEDKASISNACKTTYAIHQFQSRSSSSNCNSIFICQLSLSFIHWFGREQNPCYSTKLISCMTSLILKLFHSFVYSLQTAVACRYFRWQQIL